MSNPRQRKIPAKKRVREVDHSREVTAEPPLLSPEEEDFNRFLEEQDLAESKKPDPKLKT